MSLTEFGQFQYYIYFYRLPDDKHIDAKVYVTTEENAYGVVFEKWYDGSVEPFDLQNRYFYFLTISDIKETRYLTPETLPYYKCLASQRKKCHHATCQQMIIRFVPISLYQAKQN